MPVTIIPVCAGLRFLYVRNYFVVQQNAIYIRTCTVLKLCERNSHYKKRGYTVYCTVHAYVPREHKC